MAKIEIKETLTLTFDVYWLDDEEAALGYVMNKYENQEIVLDSSNFRDVDFSVISSDTSS